MKTKEKLNSIKKEVEEVNRKLRMLTDEELELVIGGAGGYLDNEEEEEEDERPPRPR